MGRPARGTSIATRFTTQEAILIGEAASKGGLAVREWAREVLLAAANSNDVETAIFTELLALRLLLNGVLREVALGRTMTEAQYSALLSEARRTKHQTARDVLEQYQPASKGDR